ncbi:SulP family inorganic anion transporter [Georgenia yuyongxinii]|uniref:SulP family inorganic anion transporter n=1 Tax=Georgenia yuyongxinii TaxID=2589797 RepID=UPI003631312D
MERESPGLVRGLTALRGYRREWWRGDVLAGLTVTAYLVPQVMAYSTLAGLPPVVGLWTIVPVMVVYAVLGSSRQLSVGPESTTALMVAAVLGPLAAGDQKLYATLAATLAAMVGVIALVARLVRLGAVADVISKPVLVGYMAGVAALMVSGQLEKVTGVPVPDGTFVEQVVAFLTGLDSLDLTTTAFSAVVLAALFGLRWWVPRLPGPLIVVLLATGAVILLGLQAEVDVVGEIPAGLPSFGLPTLDPGLLGSLVLPAVSVLLVAYTDNVLTARAFALRGGYRVDANAELLALGAVNVVAGLVQGFAVSSSGSRTAIAVAAGSRTQVFSLVAAVSVVGILLFARPVLAAFPMAALGALIIFAATSLVDVPEFRRLWAFRRSEFLLALATFVAVVVVGILPGIGIAVGLSILELLLRVSRPHDAVLGLVPGVAGMHDVDDYPSAHTVPGLVVYRYDSPLFFANAENFRRRALDAVAEHEHEHEHDDDDDDDDGKVAWFVLNAEANVEVDLTALDALDALRKELQDRGIVFALARVKQDLLADLQAHGLVDAIGEARIYATLPTAVEAYRAWRAEGETEPTRGR